MAVRGKTTAHIHHFTQRDPDIWTLALTNVQAQELIWTILRALDERKPYSDGTYRFAIRARPLQDCRASDPPCGGGEGRIDLVRPGKSTR